MKYAYTVLLMAVMLFGCSRKPDQKVVIKVGKDTMTLAQVKERFSSAPPTLQGYLNTDAGRKQYLDLIVRERTVIAAAKQMGFDKKTEYRQAIENFKKDQERQFKEYEESMLVEIFIKDLHQAQLDATDEEIEKYYAGHADEYQKPMEIVARHILLPTKAEAEKALARIKGGEDFSKVARDVSIDPISAGRGGEIGPFRKGDLIPEFEKAVFPLARGKMSDIVETQFGFHIIRKESQKNLPPKELADSREEIKRLIEKNKFDAWLEAAKAKNDVMVDAEAIAAVALNREEGTSLSPAEDPQAGNK